MIHPIINLVFPDNDKVVLFFSWMSSKIKQANELREFVKWHLEVNREVIKEMTFIQSIDFSNDKDVKKWAANFLKEYERKIRKMRNISNQVFERFHKFKEGEFKRIIFENPNYEKKIIEMMSIFLNKKELLIGKIIFAYREMWFLANQIYHPDFNIGSVQEYKEWISENFSNLKELNKSLEKIHIEISK